MSLPLSVILEELQVSPSSISGILRTLHYDKKILGDIPKSDSKHLVSRTLNLSRSGNSYNKWAGTSIIRVLGDNYTILSQEGVNFFSVLLKNLETYNETIDIKVLNATIDSINHLCDNIRGKPTLTREILTPRLATIITLYMEKLHHNPYLIIKSLNKLLKNHPTTFRPFGNKLRAKLLEFLNLNDFVSFPDKLKQVIYRSLALLPMIEKSEPETKWENNVKDIIRELKSIILVYGEFLNLSDDANLHKLLEKFPSGECENKIFGDLAIDVNDAKSIFKISDRIELLLNLLQVYVITETTYNVRVPLGLVLITIEAVCSINIRFTSFRNDVRDQTIRNIISSTILLAHLNAIKTLSKIASVYKGSLLPHFSNILAFLETLIPFKNKKIDSEYILANEVFYREMISTVAGILALVTNLSDSSSLVRFVDVALLLVEPRVSDAEVASTNKKDNHNNNATNGARKQKKKNNNNAIPLSDLLSHQHLFSGSISSLTISKVRQFFNIIISIVSLPPTQHYKLMRYLIIETVNAKYYNNEHTIPQDLVSLLRNAVLYPGYERISLLPIVASLLGNDPLLSVFINPRFPPLPIYIKKIEVEENIEMEEDEEEEDDEEADEVKAEVEEVVDVVEEVEQVVVQKVVEVVQQSQPLSTRKLEDDAETPIKRQKIEIAPIVPAVQVQETPIVTGTVVGEVPVVEAESEDDSDFAIPEIDLDSDDE